jgi:hypothetical protein
MRAFMLCAACVLLISPCAASPSGENAAALSKAKAEGLGERWEDRWQGRKHILYDDETVVQDGTDGAAELRDDCKRVLVRLKRSDGTTAVRRENRCE